MALVVGSEHLFKAVFTDQDDSAVDLTGATVKMRYSINGASVVEKTATLDADPTTGIATYRAADTDLTEGEMVREWEVTDGSGNTVIGGTQFHSKIRAKLP